ncbi:MAG TPA: radical SAM protein, partial [Dissulfurispiraceae bacterium]|nr:radical SAM protein [Dissulfurispiraceae bacterium]
MNRALIEKADVLLSGEQGTVFKDPGGRISICLIYPNTYRVGMANLGFQGVYGLLNARDDVVCERAFLPDEEDLAVYKNTGTPLFSLESKRPVATFDIAAFSVPFENDYPNILRILDSAKIPFLSSNRDRFHPLLIAGGVCPSFNPEPVAPVFDVMFIGDAEESLNEFLEKYKAAMQTGRVRDAAKEAALSIEGVYVPDHYTVQYHNDGTLAGRIPLYGAPAAVMRRYIGRLTPESVTTAIVSAESEFSNMYLVEAMRGCPWSCRFCLVGHMYRPLRKKEITAIKGEIARAKQYTGKIGLIGPSLTDYAHIKEVLGLRGVDFSITSLRACPKSVELVELLKGHKSISIAPEAGTERMRKVIDKRVSEHDILDTSACILETGVENLRLYFMIGLPTETQEDISGIVDLVRKIRRTSKRGNLILSIS